MMLNYILIIDIGDLKVIAHLSIYSKYFFIDATKKKDLSSFAKTLLDDEAKDSSRKDLEQGLDDACDRDFEKEMVSYLKLCICR